MAIIGLDLGGTKLATALFTEAGKLVAKDSIPLEGRSGRQVGEMIALAVKHYLSSADSQIHAIGISVPGISRRKTGTVWAPNIKGWEDYPLIEEIRQTAGSIPVSMDSDRACCILGELWQGSARGCKDAIYLAVGTGIGAGVLIDGNILRGAHDIAGSVGWMALERPFRDKYTAIGCFEYFASGDGIARLALEKIGKDASYDGPLKQLPSAKLTAHHVFEAFDNNDPIAMAVFDDCVQYWGMASANFISIFNPEKIIFGGGVFGPALKFLEAIRLEARKWAQPISMSKVTFEPSGLHGDAAIYGAGFLALEQTNNQ